MGCTNRKGYKKNFQLGSFLSPNTNFQKNVGFFHADIGLYLPKKNNQKATNAFFLPVLDLQLVGAVNENTFHFRIGESCEQEATLPKASYKRSIQGFCYISSYLY